MYLKIACYPLILISTFTTSCFADVNTTFEHIKKDKEALRAFLQAMPKGGELHYHLPGGVAAETLLSIAANGAYCLHRESFLMDKEPCDTGVSSYELLGQPELYEKTIEAWSMKNFTPKTESSREHFFASFEKFRAVVADNQVPMLVDVMKRAADQHEQYLEIMIMPDDARSASLSLTKEPLFDYQERREQLLRDPEFQEEIEKTVAASEALLPKAREQLHCDTLPNQTVCRLSVKFQYHVLREQAPAFVFQQALHAFEAASRSESLVGVNLVQPEDGALALKDYQEQMQIFHFLHEAYPKVHIALHAGELPANMASKSSNHIWQAVTIGQAERIGHGVDIRAETDPIGLAERLAKEQIAVEINLSSNQTLLQIAGKEHPLAFYLQHQVPVTLSTDDEGLLETNLTQEFLEGVLQHGLDYKTLKQINRNALTYSFLPGKSLWADPNKAIMVSPCKRLYGKSCREFIAANEKARVQRKLEVQLLRFEKRTV